jgi:hypothetical protein
LKLYLKCGNGTFLQKCIFLCPPFWKSFIEKKFTFLITSSNLRLWNWNVPFPLNWIYNLGQNIIYFHLFTTVISWLGFEYKQTWHLQTYVQCCEFRSKEKQIQSNLSTMTTLGTPKKCPL